VAALAVGAAGTTMGWLSIGTAFLLFQYTQLLEIPLDEMAEQLQEVQKAAGGISRVSELLSDQPVDPPITGPQIPRGPVELRYQDVHFSYGDEPVLQGVDLVVPAGSSVGLVGATGGGKSTLGRLTTRLLAPTAGTIQLAGIDLAAVGESDLRATIGVVPQDVEIFSSTVRDNVSLFDPTVSDAAVIDALEQVGLASKLLSGTAPLEQQLAGEGGGLSAGEAQLLALSRVFLRDPGIVLLDEATSRVDPDTEQLVLDAIDRLLQQRTAVVIAHRMATLERVSHIAVLQGGQIAEQGPRADLLAQEGTYARLVALTAKTEDAP
jgi:ABC-type multidrug transport system fused ATPase/permease subunit